MTNPIEPKRTTTPAEFEALKEAKCTATQLAKTLATDVFKAKVGPWVEFNPKTAMMDGVVTVTQPFKRIGVAVKCNDCAHEIPFPGKIIIKNTATKESIEIDEVTLHGIVEHHSFSAKRYDSMVSFDIAKACRILKIGKN